MIEPAWPHLKKVTTCRGAPRNSKTMKPKWTKAWDRLDMDRIRKWIERIPRHIEEVIRLEGGNEYKEGRTGQETRSWKGMRVRGQLSRRVDLEGLPVDDSEEEASEEASEEWEDMSGWLDHLRDNENDDEEADEEIDEEFVSVEQPIISQSSVNPLRMSKRPHRGRRLTCFPSDERGCPRTPENSSDEVVQVPATPPRPRLRANPRETPL